MNSMNNIKKINEKENKNESINSSVKINKNNSEIINSYIFEFNIFYI